MTACSQNIEQTISTDQTTSTSIDITETTNENSKDENNINDENSMDENNINNENSMEEHIIEETSQETTSLDNSIGTLESPTETVHTHDFVVTNEIKATCTKDGQRLFKCDCGKEYIKILEKLNHNYILKYNNKLIKLYTCEKCGDSYEENIKFGTAVDTDMCGDSLIEKPLLHSPHYNIMKDIFDIYHTHPKIYEADNYNLYTLPISKDEISLILDTNYYYFKYAFTEYYIKVDDNLDNDDYYMFIYYNEEQAKPNEKAYEYAKRIIKDLQIDNTVTQKEAIIRINDWLCDTKKYSGHDDFSLFESLTESKGICHDYAMAFQILCLTAGIECDYYVSEDMNHAWNKIYFSDNSHLWVDVTLNDSRVYINGKLREASLENCSKEKLNQLRSKYLLLTDEELLLTHHI